MKSCQLDASIIRPELPLAEAGSGGTNESVGGRETATPGRTEIPTARRGRERQVDGDAAVVGGGGAQRGKMNSSPSRWDVN